MFTERRQIIIKSSIKIEFDNKALQKTLRNAISKSEFNITCPNCHTDFSINGSKIGNCIKCPTCNKDIYLSDKQLNQDISKIKF